MKPAVQFREDHAIDVNVSGIQENATNRPLVICVAISLPGLLYLYTNTGTKHPLLCSYLRRKTTA